MGKFIDLTGKKFERLTVIERASDHVTRGGFKVTQYLCRCECGGEKVVMANALKGGLTKSCGCLQKEVARKNGNINITALTKNGYGIPKDLTGQRFGRLIVLKMLEDRCSNGSVAYECRCDCGNIVNIYSKHLKADNGTKSCGCLAVENASNNNTRYDLPHMHCYKGTKISCLNDTISKANTTGVRGVYFDNKRKKYVARITLCGKMHYIGRFDKLEDATMARKQAEEELFKPIIEEYGKLTEN